jgi:hypothetical protein
MSCSIKSNRVSRLRSEVGSNSICGVGLSRRLKGVQTVTHRITTRHEAVVYGRIPRLDGGSGAALNAPISKVFSHPEIASSTQKSQLRVPGGWHCDESGRAGEAWSIAFEPLRRTCPACVRKETPLQDARRAGQTECGANDYVISHVIEKVVLRARARARALSSHLHRVHLPRFYDTRWQGNAPGLMIQDANRRQWWTGDRMQ